MLKWIVAPIVFLLTIILGFYHALSFAAISFLVLFIKELKDKQEETKRNLFIEITRLTKKVTHLEQVFIEDKLKDNTKIATEESLNLTQPLVNQTTDILNKELSSTKDAAPQLVKEEVKQPTSSVLDQTTDVSMKDTVSQLVREEVKQPIITKTAAISAQIQTKQQQIIEELDFDLNLDNEEIRAQAQSLVQAQKTIPSQASVLEQAQEPIPEQLAEQARVRAEVRARAEARVRARSEARAQEHSSTTYQDDFVTLFFTKAKDWFLENTVLKVGIIILFIGLAFLLKFTSQFIHISIAQRYIFVAFVGLAFLGLGLFLRDKRREYALIIQGAGIAMMYLTCLSAIKWHGLISSEFGFIVLVFLTILLCVLAVYQDAKIMAQIGLVGALAAPILISTGSNQYLVLFTYLSLLNCGVALIAWYKAWRSLNSIAFVGSILIASAWAQRYYETTFFYTIEIFLIFNIVLFTVIALLMARQALLSKQEDTETEDEEGQELSVLFSKFVQMWSQVKIFDSTLIFGSAIIGFMFQYALIKHIPNGAAYSALAFSGFYAFLAFMLSLKPKLAIIYQGFVTLSLIFFTLTIPLLFDAQFISVGWFLEAGLIYIFSIKQRHPLLRFFSVILFALASFKYASTITQATDTLLAIDLFAHLLMIIIPVLIFYFRDSEELDWTEWELNSIYGCIALSGLALFLLPMGLFIHWPFIISMWLLSAAFLYLMNQLTNLTFLNLIALPFYFIAALKHLSQISSGDDTVLSMNILTHVLLIIVGGGAYCHQIFVLKAEHHDLEKVIWKIIAFSSCLALIFLPLGLTDATGSVAILIIILLGLTHAYKYTARFELLLGALLCWVLSLWLGLTHFERILSFVALNNWLNMLLGLATLYCAWLIYSTVPQEKNQEDSYTLLEYKRWISNSLAIIGLLYVAFAVNWLWPVAYEQLQQKYICIAMAIIALWTLLANALKWQDMLRVGFSYLVVMTYLLISQGNYLNILDINSYIYQQYLFWLILLVSGFLLHFVIAYLLRKEKNQLLLDAVHLFGFILFAPIIYFLLNIKLNSLLPINTVWIEVIWVLLPLCLLSFSVAVDLRKFWPVKRHETIYLLLINAPICVLLLIWVISFNFAEPKTQGFTYIPLLNIQELMIVWTLCTLYLWVKSVNLTQYIDEYKQHVYINGLALVAFFFISMSVARVWFFYFGVDWNSQAMLSSLGLQASWSITWTIAACTLMFYGSKHINWNIWLIGICLIALVVIKLFLVELANTDSIERIISFIVVGLLLSGIAYIAPSPRQKKTQ